MYTEKQIPKLINGQWIQKQYDYEESSGHPIAEREVVISEQQMLNDYPTIINPPKPITTLIERNDITTIFIDNNQLADLESWLSYSKIVNNYFATETFKADYKGLENIEALVNAAITENILKEPSSTDLLSLIETLKSGVRNA